MHRLTGLLNIWSQISLHEPLNAHTSICRFCVPSNSHPLVILEHHQHFVVSNDFSYDSLRDIILLKGLIFRARRINVANSLQNLLYEANSGNVLAISHRERKRNVWRCQSKEEHKDIRVRFVGRQENDALIIVHQIFYSFHANLIDKEAFSYLA